MTLPAVTPALESNAPGTERQFAIDLWGQEEPRSVINIVTPELRDAFKLAIGARPDLFAMGEKQLYKALRSGEQEPSPTDNRLRLRFWEEYDRAQSESRAMNIGLIFAGVCTRQYFYERYIRRPEEVAWLLCPPASYQIRAEEALAFGLDRMRDYLSIDPMAGGKCNVKLMELQAKIVAMLDQRVKGAVETKSVVRNMNLNVHTSDKQVAGALVGASMEQLERRLKELQRRDRLTPPPAEKQEIAVESRPLPDLS